MRKMSRRMLWIATVAALIANGWLIYDRLTEVPPTIPCTPGMTLLPHQTCIVTGVVIMRPVHAGPRQDRTY